MSPTDLYCLLKTGTKEGPSQGLSFYVCSKCKFVKQSELLPRKCSIHNDRTIELQSFITSKKDNGIRKYYRCDGREEGHSWCGFKQVLQGKPDTLSDTSQERKVLEEPKRNINNLTALQEKDKNTNATEKVKMEDRNSYQKSSKKSQPPVIISSDDDEDDFVVKRVAKTNKLDEKVSNVTRNDRVSNMDGTGGNVEKICQSKSKGAIQQQPSSFSELSKTVGAPSGGEINKSFQNKSFHQYRDSPAPKGTSHLVSRRKANSDSSDFSDSDVEVKGTNELLQELTLKDENVRKTVVSDQTEQTKHSCLESRNAAVRKVENESWSVPKGEKLETKDKALKEKKNGTEGTTQPIEQSGNTNTSEIFETNNRLDFDQHVRLRALKDDKARTVMELNKFQSSMRGVKLDTLPDKGQKLLARVDSFKQHIASLDRQIVRIVGILQERGHYTVKETEKPQQPQVIKVFPGANNTTVHVKTTSHQGNPTTVTQTEATKDANDFQVNPQFMNLPPHLLHLFAANPQAMTLYGGRMTAQRLKEVGSITTGAIEKLHKQLESCPSDTTEVRDPDGLLVSLMPHQRQALAWLEWREQQHPSGGILADDMGLGKTLTMISHVLRKKHEMKDEGSAEGWLGKDKQVEKLNKSMKKCRATLVVAPASLVHQWAKEIERRCKPHCLKFLVYHGPNRESNIHRLSNNDVVLTTYAIVSKEIGTSGNAEMAVEDDDEQDEQTKAKQPLLLRIGWERIILDEAHDIKNHKSTRAQSVCRLRAACRWALTGTPIQNDLKDMYSLLRFLRFSPFDELKVWKKQIENAKVSMKRLNTIVKALLLRRTKDQTTQTGKPLVDLPNKNYVVIKVELGAEERKIYDKLYKKTQSTVRAYVHRHQDPLRPGDPSYQSTKNYNQIPHAENTGIKADGGDSSKSSAMATQGQNKNTGSQILVFLLRLRQCCSHLSLMKSHLESESIETDGIELSLEQQMKGMLLEEDLEVAPPTSGLPQTSFFEISAVSTKLSHVMEKIQTLNQEKPDDKSVIMSQWTKMLEIIAHHLKKQGISYSLIQGNVPAKKRTDIVDDFNRAGGDAKVMLVSLCAGGVGLNLIGGNHLFLMDCHWNPALEEQASDRIYRIGQKKDVMIYRFICNNTIEEKISTLQQGKLSLAKSVLSGGGAKHQKLSLDDLRMLFGV